MRQGRSVVCRLDIGGTKCAFCCADQAGEVLYRYQVMTESYQNWNDLLEALICWGNEHAPRPVAVGISCGGPLDSQKGIILGPPNLLGWDCVPIVDWINKRLGVPAFLQNDANACALAEWMFGSGRGTQNMVFLTFGTGIGAGLILDGKLYEGACGMAGEFGHIRLTNNGPEGYGKCGSIEGYCSGGGLFQMTKLYYGKGLSAKELTERAEYGDNQAKQILDLSAQMLGRGVSMLIDLLNPECIVIGSIFSRAEKWYRDGMEQMIEAETLPASRQACRVVPAQLGESIGDVAAITVAWNGWKGLSNHGC